MANDFYKEFVYKHSKHLFLKCVSCNRFAELEKNILSRLALRCVYIVINTYMGKTKMTITKN